MLPANSIELRHLRSFVAVAEERHFTRAAERLHMAQSPLSAQIRQLEQRVGGALFVRGPGRVSLTEAGEALLGPARATLATVADGVDAVHAVVDGRRGCVSVLIGPGVAPEVALDAVRALAREAPEVDVVMQAADDAEARLAAGRADAAFLRGPIGSGVVAAYVVATEPRVALANRGHPLAARDSLTLDDLNGEAVVEVSGARMGIGPALPHVEDLLVRVAAGRAVGVLPAGLLRGGSTSVAAVPVLDAPPSAILVAHPPVARSAAAVRFVEAARWSQPARDEKSAQASRARVRAPRSRPKSRRAMSP